MLTAMGVSLHLHILSLKLKRDNNKVGWIVDLVPTPLVYLGTHSVSSAVVSVSVSVSTTDMDSLLLLPTRDSTSHHRTGHRSFFSKGEGTRKEKGTGKKQ